MIPISSLSITLFTLVVCRGLNTCDDAYMDAKAACQIEEHVINDQLFGHVQAIHDSVDSNQPQVRRGRSPRSLNAALS